MNENDSLRREVAQLRRQLERQERSIERLENRLLAFENSRFVQLLRWPGRMLLDWKGRLGQALLDSPFHPLYLRIARPHAAEDLYQQWIAREQPPAGELSRRPLISIVMPVYRPRREWLEAAVESVRAQSYDCWQLCVCQDGPGEGWIEEYFRGLGDPRICFIATPERHGISGATNTAGALAHGEYVGLLDQDDVLAPHALRRVAAEDADVIYSDEDRLDENGRRVEPIFKPGWSPDLLLGCMYMTHFLVIRRPVLERAGWLRSEFDGSQDYDLALRTTEAAASVRHIPHILYHWRKHPESTAANSAVKPYAHEAGKKAVIEALARRGRAAKVEDGALPNTYHVRWPVSGRSKVTIVICTRSPRWLRKCLHAVARTTAYANRELVIVHHRVMPDGEIDAIAAEYAAKVVPFTGAFNFSVMNSLGVAQTSGDLLLFLNDDIEPLDPAWLTEMVAHAERPEVGIVGARLLYPSGAVQHAGMAIGIMEGSGHPHRDTFASPWWHWMHFTRNVAAVTGACLLARRDVYEKIGGFDPQFPNNYNDADLCLRARAAGYEVIYEPAAVLRHYECRTRKPGIRVAEMGLWAERWGDWVDPYYSPNLTRTREDASIRIEG